MEPDRHLFPDFELDPEMGIYICFVCLLNALKYLQSYDNLILFGLFPLCVGFLPDVYIYIEQGFSHAALALVWKKRLNLLQWGFCLFVSGFCLYCFFGFIFNKLSFFAPLSNINP